MGRRATTWLGATAAAGLALGCVVGCDSTVEFPDDQHDGGGAAAEAEEAEPQTCEEFCSYVLSFGCGCSCSESALVEECLDATKALWACMVQNYHPKLSNGDGCGAPECIDLRLDLQDCEDAH